MVDARWFFEEKTWLVYGKLSRPKDEIIALILERQGRVIGSVAKTLSFIVWKGETLLPGDEASHAKTSKLLDNGGIVVGQDDFELLLEGTVPKRLQSVDTGALDEKHKGATKKSPAKTSSGAKKKTATRKKASATKTKKAKPKKLRSMALSDLLDATLQEMEKVPAWGGADFWRYRRGVERLVERCVQTGRMEEAHRLCVGISEPFRGTAMLSLALAENTPTDLAVERLLAAPDAVEPSWEMGNSVGASYEVAAALNAAKLVSAAQGKRIHDAALQFLDVLFEDFYSPAANALLETLDDTGNEHFVRELFLRWRDAELSSWQESKHTTRIWQVCRNPKEIIEWVADLDESISYDVALAVGGVEGWSDGNLRKLFDGLGEYQDVVAAKLVQQGHAKAAEKVLQLSSELSAETWLEYFREVEDHDALKSHLKRHEDIAEWLPYRVNFGVASWEELADVSSRGHTMLCVSDLIGYAEACIEERKLDHIDQVMERIDALFATRKRTTYDEGIETSLRSKFLDLQIKVMLQEDPQADVHETLSVHLKGLKELQNYAMDKAGRAQAAEQLLLRITQAGKPDLAMKAVKKIPKAERSRFANEVATSFLPLDPSGGWEAFVSLAALGSTATHGIAHALLAAGGESSFGLAIWHQLTE